MVRRGTRGGGWLEMRGSRFGGTIRCTVKMAALCGRVGIPKAKERKLTCQYVVGAVNMQ